VIHTVRIRGFKRFDEMEFRLPRHVVLAGPNNTGKTTVLQAIASWSLALQRWWEHEAHRPGGYRHTRAPVTRRQSVPDSPPPPQRNRGYPRAPIARQAFTAVPLRSFDLLWKDRRYQGPIEIELRHDAGWSVTMEFIADSTEQIYVRPGKDVPLDTLRGL